MAYVFLILAILSRVLPVLTHGYGANITLMGAALIFFGAELHGRGRWQVLLAVAALAATDWWLTVYGYGYAFHPASYVVTWLWYAVVILGVSAWLGQRSWFRIGASAVAAPTGFFLLSNGVVWLRSGMYPHTGAGLVECYVAGLPFYRNDLVSTVVFTPLLFLLASVVHAAMPAREANSDGSVQA